MKIRFYSTLIILLTLMALSGYANDQETSLKEILSICKQIESICNKQHPVRANSVLNTNNAPYENNFLSNFAIRVCHLPSDIINQCQAKVNINSILRSISRDAASVLQNLSNGLAINSLGHRCYSPDSVLDYLGLTINNWLTTPSGRAYQHEDVIEDAVLKVLNDKQPYQSDTIFETEGFKEVIIHSKRVTFYYKIKDQFMYGYKSSNGGCETAGAQVAWFYCAPYDVRDISQPPINPNDL